jgi:hypothetical protein
MISAFGQDGDWGRRSHNCFHDLLMDIVYELKSLRTKLQD